MIQFHKHMFRKVGTSVAALLITALATDRTHAQWQVIDRAAIASNEHNQLLQLDQLVSQYTQMMTQYKAMLTSLSSLNLNVITTNNQLQTIRDATKLVQQACPGATSLPSMALDALGMDSSIMDGEIVTQQRAICTKITLLEIDKYNTVALMLNHMNDYFSGLKQLTDTANQVVGAVENAVGDRQALLNQTMQTQTSLSTEMANVQQHLQAVDATISALKDQQSLLAKIALKGSNANGPGALTGQIIQAGAFSAAFPQP